MTRESTLDEFLGGGSDGEDDDADEGDDEREPADVTADGTDDVDPDADPAAVTCEWTPGGAACEDCGATVERRWTDGDARICADCKEW